MLRGTAVGLLLPTPGRCIKNPAFKTSRQLKALRPQLIICVFPIFRPILSITCHTAAGGGRDGELSPAFGPQGKYIHFSI